VPGLRPASFQSPAPAFAAPTARAPAAGGISQALPMVRFGPNGMEPVGTAQNPAHFERLPFDWRRVQMRQIGGQWVVGFGEVTFASLASEEEARLALTVLRTYRFTEWRRVGQGEESFSYFLINGQTPHGVMVGLTAEAFQPEALSIRQVGNRHAICLGGNPLVTLGERVEEAQELLREIKRQRFDHLCRVGTTGQPLTFLTRSR
jgi:hypothetical protein